MIERNEGASSRRPNRRQVGAGLIAALATSGARAQDGTRVLEPRSYDAALIPAFSFEVIEIDARGRIGAMVRDHGTGRVADWAQDDTFPIASVYKLLLVARVLSRIDGGADQPDRTIAIGAEDVAGYAPVLGDRAGTSMTLDALCAAAVTQSDSAAADILLRETGGVVALEDWLRASGDGVTRIAGGARSTPAMLARHVDRLVLGEALSPDMRGRLAGWMIANRTGDARIRAGVPEGWVTGDKTGTRIPDTTADVAFVVPPGRAPMTIVTLIADSALPVTAQERLHAALTRIACGNLV